LDDAADEELVGGSGSDPGGPAGDRPDSTLETEANDEHGEETASKEEEKEEEKQQDEESVCKGPIAVAIEGQRVPGTRYERFDPALAFDYLGFRDPKTNDQGNVTFRATYSEDRGAGIFAWSKKHDLLLSVAKTGDWTEAGELPRGLLNYSGPVFNDENQIAFSVRDIGGINTASPDGVIANGNTVVDRSAIFQAFPKHDGCRDFDLELIARTGDCAPRGGIFREFFGLAENDKGDVAFIATYDGIAIPSVQPEAAPDPELQAELDAAGLPAPPPNGGPGFGVFLKRHGKERDERCYCGDVREVAEGFSSSERRDDCGRCDHLEAVVRSGDYLKGTHGGRLCGLGSTLQPPNSSFHPIEGPWLNNRGDVLFIANCIDGRPDLEGSLFIRRKGEHHPELFVAIGDKGPKGSRIGRIGMGQPAVNDEEATMLLFSGSLLADAREEGATAELRGGEYPRIPPEAFIVKKDLDDERDHECNHFEICAVDGERLTRKYELDLEYDPFEFPTIDATGLVAFSAHAVLRGAMPPPPVLVPELVSLEATAESRVEPRYELPPHVAAVFTCNAHDLDAAVVQYDEKPVDWKDLWWSPAMIDQAKALSSSGGEHHRWKFRFGEVQNQSNDDDFVTFVDFSVVQYLEGAAPELQPNGPLFPSGFPTGVFITGTEED
jgi:hypothetical protein